jgi:hypothetical protein
MEAPAFHTDWWKETFAIVLTRHEHGFLRVVRDRAD